MRTWLRRALLLWDEPTTCLSCGRSLGTAERNCWYCGSRVRYRAIAYIIFVRGMAPIECRVRRRIRLEFDNFAAAMRKFKRAYREALADESRESPGLYIDGDGSCLNDNDDAHGGIFDSPGGFLGKSPL